MPSPGSTASPSPIERCASAARTCLDECYSEAWQIVGREMTVEQVIAEIALDTAFYDESHGGVTFSGGEPLLQRDFLLALLPACQARELHTAVDTSGSAGVGHGRSDPPLHRSLPVRSQVDRRRAASRVPLASPISRSCATCGTFGAGPRDRDPHCQFVPGLNDDDVSIHQLADFIAALPNRHPIDLLPYHHIAVDKYLRLGKPYRLFETHARC